MFYFIFRHEEMNVIRSTWFATQKYSNWRMIFDIQKKKVT